MGWFSNHCLKVRIPPLPKLKGNKMNLRDIVHRLEEIEQLCDGETQPLVKYPIDEIIEHDMKMDKLFSKVNRDIEDDILHKPSFGGNQIWFCR